MEKLWQKEIKFSGELAPRFLTMYKTAMGPIFTLGRMEIIDTDKDNKSLSGNTHVVFPPDVLPVLISVFTEAMAALPKQ